MTEIPEHLLKRAQAAREKAQADAGAAAPDDAPAPAADAPGDATAAEPAADPRIPAHLIERSGADKARAEGGGEPE